MTGNLEISQRIKQLRKQHGMLQKELAECVNVSQQNISNIENGTCKVYDDLIRQFARCFQVSTDYLLGLTDDPLPNMERAGSVLEEEGAGYTTYRKSKMKSHEELLNTYDHMNDTDKVLLSSISDTILKVHQQMGQDND